MSILLHTIAVEPSRWTEKRVSQPLTNLLPSFAASGFYNLEIYEPHLATPEQRPSIKSGLKYYGITPVVLSSYLDLVAGTPEFSQQLRTLEELVEDFQFQKIRIFPGMKMHPADRGRIEALTGRLAVLTSRFPRLEILLETHDGSLADDPGLLVDIIRRVGAGNLGLLFQPTVFTQEMTERQFLLQKPYIRHIHLQNRTSSGHFTGLADGVIHWDRFLRELPGIDVSIEFVPSGICAEADFDLGTVLRDAAIERDYIESILHQDILRNPR